MRKFNAIAVVAVSLLWNGVAALPANALTVTKLDSDCSTYPDYNKDTAIAGPWTVVSEGTGNSILEGVKVSAETFTEDGINRFGFVS